MARIKQSEYATKRGVSRQAISKLVRLGKITVDPVDRLIDEDLADRQLAELNPAQSKAARSLASPGPGVQPPGPSVQSPSDYLTSKAARERYAALREQLEYEQEAGLLVKREPIGRALGEVARTLRDTLLAMDDRLSTVFAGENDAAKIADLMKVEHTRALAEFVKLAEARISRVSSSN